MRMLLRITVLEKVTSGCVIFPSRTPFWLS